MEVTADEAITTPVFFAEHILKLGAKSGSYGRDGKPIQGIYDWQSDVLTWFEDTTVLTKGSVLTPNGAGKSSVIVAALALWWISVHPTGKVVITSKDAKQLDRQVWPAMTAHREKFPAFDFVEREIRNGKGGFITGFTTDEAGRAEGWHKLDDIDGPLLYIIDEAKSVADAIDQASDRCTYNAKLITSSPGWDEGFFYESQTTKAETAEKRGYKVKAVGLLDCPHIPQSRIDNVIDTYGADHPFTLSTLYGKFMRRDDTSTFVIQKGIVEAAMETPPPYVHGGKVAMCDFAAGGAENTFTLKEGNRVTQRAWKDPDPMRAIGQFIFYFVEAGLTPAQIYGDAGGMGIPILKRMAELNWPINPINNGDPAIDDQHYENRGAEMWFTTAKVLQGRNIILPNDPVLKEQLTNRKMKPSNDGTVLGIESKKDLAKRNVPSPDRGDGVVGVLSAEEQLASSLFDTEGLAALEAAARAGTPEHGRLGIGADKPALEVGAKDSWLTVWERPVFNRSYVLVVNPARHSEPLLDHSVMVLRMPYTDDRQRQHPIRVVAKVRRPLKVDAGPLAVMVGTICRYYGGCIAIPVVNERGDVIDKLQSEGLHIYTDEDFETTKHGRNQATTFGWHTDAYTRSLWIGEIAEAVREQKVLVEDVETVMQLFQLTANNAEYKRDAESLGVGMKLQNYASAFIPPRGPTLFGGRASSTIPKSMIS